MARRKGPRVAWTPQEDAYLTRAWGTNTRRTIMARLPRHSWMAIGWHARVVLGLKAKQGRWSIETASAKTGYSVTALRRILAARGVEGLRVYGASDGRGRRPTASLRFEPDDVLAAVDAEMDHVRATESFREAAAARRMDYRTLIARCKALGLATPDGRAGVRILTADADRAAGRSRTKGADGT